MQMEKTEKSMSELEVSLNANYDFSNISESGTDLKVSERGGRGYEERENKRREGEI